MSGTAIAPQDGLTVPPSVKEQPYEKEFQLQRVLAHRPHLLNTITNKADGMDAPRWLLVSREAPVPERGGGAGRWSIDLLFLDQDAVPTFVEVKRGKNTQVRRMVVGQMLDYAANALLYWRPGDLRAIFNARCTKEKRNSENELRTCLGEGLDQERFWQSAEDNLRKRRVRLVFVADKIPRELRRIVEFLNRDMVRTEVFALEVRQFMNESGVSSVEPRVVSRPAEAAADTTPWDQRVFFAELMRRSEVAAVVARQLFEWAKSRQLEIKWDTNRLFSHFFPIVKGAEREHTLLRLSTSGHYRVWLDPLTPPFDDSSRREHLVRALSSALGSEILLQTPHRSAQLPLARLHDDQTLQRVLAVLDQQVGWLQSDAAIRDRSGVI